MEILPTKTASKPRALALLTRARSTGRRVHKVDEDVPSPSTLDLNALAGGGEPLAAASSDVEAARPPSSAAAAPSPAAAEQTISAVATVCAALSGVALLAIELFGPEPIAAGIVFAFASGGGWLLNSAYDRTDAFFGAAQAHPILYLSNLYLKQIKAFLFY